MLVPCEGCSLWARVVFAVDDGIDWEGVAVDDASVELDEGIADDADDEAEEEDDDDDSDDDEDDDGVGRDMRLSFDLLVHVSV